MTMIRLTLIKHRPNQHGFGVSLARYVNDELTHGFVLHSCDTLDAQERYIAQLREVLSVELEDHTQLWQQPHTQL